MKSATETVPLVAITGVDYAKIRAGWTAVGNDAPIWDQRLEHGANELALPYLLELINPRNKVPEALVSAAARLVDLELYTEARTQLDAALKVDPDHDRAHQLLARIERAEKRAREVSEAVSRIERLIEFQLKHWQEHNYGWWAVCLSQAHDGGPLIGWAGLQYLPETDETEVGYLLGSAHWGRGLATEAARASVRYGFEKLGLRQIVGIALQEAVLFGGGMALNTWGDVQDIGLQSTRVRTRDNRMVVVPNSVIGKKKTATYVALVTVFSTLAGLIFGWVIG